MTYTDLKQNLRTWIADTLSVEVIFSHGSGPRPNGQYAVLNIVSMEKLIEDVRVDTRLVGGEIQADYKGIRKILVSVNVYRGNNQEQMIKLRQSLSKILTQDYFNNIDIGIINQNDIQHVPEQIGKSWENRSQCDFFFHYIPTFDPDEDIGEIKQIEVTNEINGEIINVSDI